MIENDVTLNANTYIGTPGDKTYNLVSLDNTAGSGTLRRVSATALTAPETLRISHRTIKKGNVTFDQHLVRLDETGSDPLLGTLSGSSWFVTLVPRGSTVITANTSKSLTGRLIHALLKSGYFDKLLNGES